MTTTVELIHAGYARDSGHVGSSISLIRDGDAIIVADPGLVASHARILDPLRDRGIAADAVTHVFLSHHHPDHTMNAGLFPNAEVVDFWARYQADLWLDHGGDGWQMTEHAQLWLTPGHTQEDATLVIRADDATYALTHLWWRSDRTPDIDPFAPDQAILQTQRARVLAVADIVIPGHGEAFRVEREAGDRR
ncbi:MAG TPA: MBL fold metallo-hydrolase [Candidatus Limnocylindrales bacterium]|jgi:glyoxylase-like metal-dependent hydrolase (beta-lactamase superfamily II)|nr:MBL fold metallo-hydrolase [Candidatus Limnocylindrales bacterium]